MRAAVYCRISLDRRDNQLGVGRQEEDCRELCGTLGWDVAEVYVDNDISATSGKPRPAYRAMLNAVKDGLVDAIVCWHPDRLYRRVKDLEELVEICDAQKVQIATVRAGTVDLTTPSGRLVAGLLAQVAKYEGEHKAERWRRSFRQRREAGQPARGGPRMYGWTTDGALIPEEAENVRWAASALLSGGSLRAVTFGLNARGARSTLGNPWTLVSTRTLLRNPRLAGWVTYKDEIVSRGTWPPILTDDEWEAVNAFLANRAGREVRPRVSILLGLIHCGVCEGRMVTGRRATTKRGGNARVYKCPTRGCVEIAADRTEKIVEAYAKERLSSPLVRDELARTNTDGTAARLAHELTVLQARHRSLTDALAEEEGRSVSELLRAIERVQARIEETQERIASLSPVRLPASQFDWPTDVGRRRDLLGVVVRRVWIDRADPTRAGVFQRERIRID